MELLNQLLVFKTLESHILDSFCKKQLENCTYFTLSSGPSVIILVVDSFSVLIINPKSLSENFYCEKNCGHTRKSIEPAFAIQSNYPLALSMLPLLSSKHFCFFLFFLIFLKKKKSMLTFVVPKNKNQSIKILL